MLKIVGENKIIYLMTNNRTRYTFKCTFVLINLLGSFVTADSSEYLHRTHPTIDANKILSHDLPL